MALVPTSSHGGPSLQTFSLVTNPNTFVAPDQVIDCVGPSICWMKYTITAFTPDGETPGLGNTQIQVFSVPTGPKRSADGVTYTDINAIGSGTIGGQFTVGDYDSDGAVTPRYLKAVGPQVIYGTFALYNGANHPTATVRLDVYVTRLTT